MNAPSRAPGSTRATKSPVWEKVSVPGFLLLKAPMLKCFQADRHDGHLSVIVGPEPQGWHLSISHRRNDGTPGRYPTWDEIKDARYRLAPDTITMAMFLPPPDEFVDLHPTTFHLWETTQ